MRVTLGIMFAAGLVAVAFSQVAPQKGDWPQYGRDPGGSRYSPLTQINTSNVDHPRSGMDLSHGRDRPIIRGHADPHQ